MPFNGCRRWLSAVPPGALRGRLAALTPAMAKECLTVGGADVARPVGALAEHRDQVALATELGDDDREGDQPSAASATNLERRHPPGQIPAENATADTRFCTRANRFGRPSAIQPAQVIGVAGHPLQHPIDGSATLKA